MTFDKSNWKAVTFSEVCRNVNDNERDPLGAGIERYVGLEHIEPENLHIRSWGNVADGTTFTKVFRPGHVLFGKRRAYQKKAALADFTGLCSGDILVLEPNTSKIDPRFFPFLVQSDRFFDFAVQTSAGSLSPRTKFQDLAQFQFLLPPKDQQARLAELLWAGDAVVEGYEKLKDALKNAQSAYFATIYHDPELRTMSLGDCLEYSQYGISESLSDSGEIPVLRMNNLMEGKVTFDELKYIDSKSIPKLEALILEKGDILFNRTNSFDLVGKVGIFDSDMRATFASYLIRLKANDNIVSPKYLNLYLNSVIGQRLIKIHRTPGVSQSNINPENLKKIDAPILPISKQEALLKKINALEDAETGYQLLKINSKSALNLLLNQIFTS